MDLFGDVLNCAQPTPAVDHSERIRAYEIAAYLSAASFPFAIADGPPSNPAPSNDLTLNALVQHGVYKLDCDRAFLSLIDNRNQYICAEMTKNQPLAGQDPAQPLLLGTARIALEWGVCPYTMAIFHGKAVDMAESPYIVADQSYFCIKDFRQVPTFATRPYVAGYPHMVSYIEVPLRSLSGYILGSYCLVDNKPREFLRPEALDVVREVTASISSYLNMKRAEGSRTRSERMVDGLRQFVNSERIAFSLGYGVATASGDRSDPFTLPVFCQQSQNGAQSSQKASPGIGNVKSSPSDSIGNSFLSSMSTLSLSSETPMTNTPASSPGSSDPIGSTSSCTSPNSDSKANPPSPVVSQKNASNPALPEMSDQINDLFLKAASTIGYAMNLDGLVFFDATTPNTRYKRSVPSSSSTNQGLLPPNATQARILSEYHDTALKQQLICRPSKSLIQQLIGAYPQGRVFAVDEHGVLDDYAHEQSHSTDPKVSSNLGPQNSWNGLFECVPSARYILFLPLWHYQREACFATCLAWVSSTGKTLDSTDKSSLTVFGNSLMAEIFRLEALLNTQSKSDFISSISHELRSPLHGILTTLELMQETTKDPDLLSMVEMIESCSSTLLDTFDHLLEFSKINSRRSHTRSDHENAVVQPADAHATKVLVDLQSLVDDVVEMVSLSHMSILQMESGLKKEHRNASTDHAPVILPKPLLVTTHIERKHDWFISVEKGAWTRIILNICSNAMKYTRSGHIEVALRRLKKADGDSEYISFVVTDTGIGMSEEFLKYHLFTPFMQENNLSPGSGLGLNIVRNIVESLEGRIFVESRQNEGTRVTVNIPLDPGLERSLRSNIDETFTLQGRMHGFSLRILSISAAGHESRLVPPPEVLQRSIRNICEDKFGMTVMDVSPTVPLNSDIVLIDTHALTVTDKSDLETLFLKLLSGTFQQVVVLLGVPVKAIAHIFGTEDIVCVPSPITGKRLWVALNSALKHANLRKSISSMSRSDSDISRLYGQIDGSSTEVPSGNENTIRRHEHSSALLTQASLEEPNSASSSEGLSFEDNRIIDNTASQARPCRFKRFLLVDDNLINLKVLSAFAQRLGLPFSTAGDGAEAVRLYKQAALEEATPFDCIFMDLSMPVMNGFQAVAAIRQFEDGQQRLQNTSQSSSDGEVSVPACRAYILALTGLGSEGARSSAKELGFDEFLVKPVRFKDILPLLLTAKNSK